ncbi:MAG: hypothetical protein NZM27_02375 [Acetobacteraceae bacterium]|nr:hypothetical protein [Acetobacteraceae bacterium]
MASESARACSAAEAAFRVPYANARRRRIALVALDAGAAGLAARLAEQGFPRAVSLPAEASGGAWLEALLAPAREVSGLLAEADHLFLLASAEGDAAMAGAVADAARERGVPVSAFLVAPAAADDGTLARPLSRLRQVAKMLVVARDEADVAAVLTALRA